MKAIYVAGPFRASSVWEMEANIRRAEEVALEVWRKGYAAICPHAMTRFYQGALPDETWLDGDLEILSRCDGVLMVGEWWRSVGSRREQETAIRLEIPLYYSLDELP